jgi:hypothetical protein
MDDEPKTNEARGPDKHKTRVENEGWCGVQRMEADTAAGRVEDGSCEEVVQVNKHCEQHNQPNPLPVSTKEEPSNQAGYESMERKMNS